MDDWIAELEDIEDFEELNNLENRKSMPYDKYFGEMDLTKEEKEKRKSFAEKLDDVMLFIFSLITVMRANQRLNEEYVRQQLISRYNEVLSGYMPIDDYLTEYVNVFADETLGTTYRNIDNPYFLSIDRVILIAENEANGVFGYKEFADAIRQGKTMKEWVDIRDRRERKTHIKVGGTKIPILQAFIVGNSLMNFPKDISYGADMKEIANCRCTVKYF